MKAVELSEVSAVVPRRKHAAVEPFLRTDRGHVVATIVPGDERDAETVLLSVNAKFRAILERSRKRQEAEGGLSSDAVGKRLGLPSTRGR